MRHKTSKRPAGWVEAGKKADGRGGKEKWEVKNGWWEEQKQRRDSRGQNVGN